MVTVWMRADTHRRQSRFHRDPGCRQLTKAPSRGTSHDLVEVDLADTYGRPCRTCYPDAPHVEILKRYCYVCQSPYACEHNGGIAVTDRIGRRRYVWPDSNQMPYYRRQAQQTSA